MKFISNHVLVMLIGFILIFSLSDFKNAPKNIQEYNYRCLLNTTQSGVMSVSISGNGQAIVNSSLENSSPEDVPVCGAIGMPITMENGSAVMALDAEKTYWWIPFGENQTPLMVYNGSGGGGGGGGGGGTGDSKVECHCGSTSGPTAGCEPMVNTSTCKMYCTTTSNEPCTNTCHMVIIICSVVRNVPGVLVEASSVNYNGQEYSN